MKAVVNRHLNVRVGKPGVNAPNPSYYSPGDEVEIIGAVIGDQYKGNNIWYRLRDDTYIWSGGVTAPDGEVPKPQAEFDFSKLLKLNMGSVVSPGGLGGVIAMFDSGVSHISIKPKIKDEKSFVPGTTTPRDEKGHGTCVAGILCGHDDVIKSLTPECQIVNFRIARGTAVLSSSILNALKALLESDQKVDVLNLSLSVAEGIVPHVDVIIDQLLLKGTVTVVAAGNGNNLTSMASLKNVIKVCAIPKNEFFVIKQQSLNSEYDCAFIDTAIPSTFLNDRHDYIQNVSAYTPIVSSIVLAHLKDKPALTGTARLDEAKLFLKNSTFPISDLQSPEDFKLMKP